VGEPVTYIVLALLIGFCVAWVVMMIGGRR
jgi:hypothetical protein